jgi:hypothetical protein
LTIDKIGPGGPKPGGINETLPVDKSKETADARKVAFTEKLKPVAPAAEADHLAATIQQASSKIAAGEITREQAIELILSTYRQELLSRATSPEETDATIDFIREIIADDPAIDALLSGK